MLGIPYEGRMHDYANNGGAQQWLPQAPPDPQVIAQRQLREEQDAAYQASLLVRAALQWPLPCESSMCMELVSLHCAPLHLVLLALSHSVQSILVNTGLLTIAVSLVDEAPSMMCSNFHAHAADPNRQELSAGSHD